MNLRIAIVTRARAPYHKALQESLSAELGADGGHLRIFYPQHAWCPFTDESSLPQGPHLSVAWMDSQRVSPKWKGNGTRWSAEAISTQLPSAELWRGLTNYDPAVVWVHEYSPFTLGALLWAKRHHRPVVVSSEVGLANAHFFPWQVRLWHRLWSHLADGIVACSPAALKSGSGERRPVVAAFHAADSRMLKPMSRNAMPPDAPLQIVQTGRVLPRKGADLLLTALAGLRDRGFNHWRLRLLGPDTDDWGRSHITRLHLESQVEITGHLEEAALWEAFGQADVFVLATRQDTYAAVVHEAACLGLPLLVSRHAGAAEALVNEGINGFTFLPENTDDLAARISSMTDPATRERMAQASRLTAERFSAHERARAVRGWLQQHFSL